MVLQEDSSFTVILQRTLHVCFLPKSLTPAGFLLAAVPFSLLTSSQQRFPFCSSCPSVMVAPSVKGMVSSGPLGLVGSSDGYSGRGGSTRSP